MTVQSPSSPARPAASARRPPAGWPPRASTSSPPPAGRTGWPTLVDEIAAAGAATAGGLRRHRPTSRWPAWPPRWRDLDGPVTAAGQQRRRRPRAGPGRAGAVDDWQWMYDVNVLGTLRVTKALLPALEASGAGTIVMISSTAGFIVYEGGGGYTAAKHAQTALAEHAAAGAVRPAGPGDRDRPRHGAHRRVRAGPLRRRRRAGGAPSTPGWPSRWSPTTSPTASPGAATRPHHVNIDRLVVRPLAQAAQHKVHRAPLTMPQLRGSCGDRANRPGHGHVT